MRDEHREKLDNRLTPIQLYNLTPKTNCGECGLASCLAFATQAIVGQVDLDACPYLDSDAIQPFRLRLSEQHKSGIGVKREGFEKALQFLRQEVKKWDFRSIASSLGAVLDESRGEPTLVFPYLDGEVRVTVEDVVKSSGEEISPYEKIFIYNYVIGGAGNPSGMWVGMESLPNSVSKIKSLQAHCEAPLSRAFSGKIDRLPIAVSGIGQEVSRQDKHVDYAAHFQILPKLPIRVLWWDADPAEGFEARAKFLFDEKVLDTLDLESLIFACEQVADRLLAAVKGRD